MLFLFLALNTFNAEIKIKDNILTSEEKMYLSDFIETDNRDIIEKSKQVQVGYSPIDNKENIVTGDFLKIKIKQLKLLKPDEIEAINFPQTIHIKKIGKDGDQKKEEITKKKQDINFKKNIVAAGEKIYLSDFIETEKEEIKNTSKSVLIGFSPAPGEKKKIKNDMIKIKMKQIGVSNIEDYDTPLEFEIERESQKLDKNEIIRIVTGEIKDKYGDESYKIKIDNENIEDIIIPQGIYNIKIYSNPGETKKLGKFRVACDIEVNGAVYKKININGEVGILKNVFIVNNDFTKGTQFELEYADSKEILIFVQNQIKKDVVVEDYKGKIFKKNVKKGEIVEDGMFEKRKLFKKNDIVNAQAVIDDASIKIELKALEDGFEGESVPLINQKSKKIVNGIVQKDGSVVITVQK